LHAPVESLLFRYRRRTLIGKEVVRSVEMRSIHDVRVYRMLYCIVCLPLLLRLSGRQCARSCSASATPSAPSPCCSLALSDYTVVFYRQPTPTPRVLHDHQRSIRCHPTTTRMQARTHDLLPITTPHPSPCRNDPTNLLRSGVESGKKRPA
jgi:hypothetical protein